MASDTRSRTGLPEFTLEGSELSRSLGGGRVYLSQERRHWGPGWGGSLVLDGGAPAIAAFGWRKNDERPFEWSWLSWLGPWGADFFIGGLASHREPERPWLVGLRITLEPLEGLQIGLSRTLQWGGRRFDESPRSLLRSLFGKDPNSDIDGGEQGNQLAGADLRYGWRWGASGTAALYGQAIGEDEAGEMPYKFLLLAGGEAGGRFSSEAPGILNGASWRLFVEWADTGMRHAYGTHQAGAYQHHVYRQGYTHHRQVLGHQIGGDAELVSLGGLLDWGRSNAMVVLHTGKALEGAQRLVPGARVHAASLALQRPVGEVQVGASLNVVWHNGQRDHLGQAWVGWGW
ncbi:capsule assembly Wzi family protein [Caldimonas sp.]|uniref:capsule assembly Wzi family protein n=1 Tax=Caldimonas sp. TaxID=2838790 RepID=UPI00391BF8C1